MPAVSKGATVADDNDSTELTLNGYVKGFFLNRPNCLVICSEDSQFPQYVLHLNTGANDLAHSAFAEGQDLLQDILAHFKARPVHLQVTFKAASGSKAAYDVKWLGDGTKTLLLSLSDCDSPTWLVIQPSRDPFATTNILNRSLPSGRLFEAQQFWCVDPPDTTRKAAFVILAQAADWPLLKGQPHYGELLAQNADHADVSEYLTSITAECAQPAKENGRWGDLEQQCLRGLNAALQPVIRRALLKQLADDQLADAWDALSNQQMIKDLHPEWARRRQQEDATREILSQLRVRAVDLEIRNGKIKEIGITDGHEKLYEWRAGASRETAAVFLRQVLGSPAVGCLAGHNIIRWDLAHLHSELGAEGERLLDLPVLDTLLLESILQPRSRKSLELGGTHTALDDAKATVDLLQKQIIRLARLPAETLDKWIDTAGPALHQLLKLVGAHRAQLYSAPAPADPDADDVNTPPPFLSDLNRQLAEIPEHEQHLLLVPRQLLSAVMRLDALRNALVLDPGPTNTETANTEPVYIETPDAQWLAGLGSSKSPAGYFYGDLFLLLDAFVHAARSAGQLPYLCAMNDWGRNLLRDLLRNDKTISLWGVDYQAVLAAAPQPTTRMTLAPFDSLAGPSFVEFLHQKHYVGIIVFAPELSAGSILNVHSLNVALPYSWQTQRTAHGWVMGLDLLDERDKNDLADWGANIGKGWRGWIEGKGFERADLYGTPSDLVAFVSSLELADQPRPHSIMLPLPSGVTVVHVGRQAQLAPGGRSTTMLSPASPYRAEYLGQVLALAVPRARAKRILLALDSTREELRSLEWLTLEDLYASEGSKLRRLQKLRDKTHGLVICHVDDLFDWLLVAHENDISRPFDEIIVNAWPLDNPRLIPPFTRSDLRSLRTTEEPMEDSDEDPGALEALDAEEEWMSKAKPGDDEEDWEEDEVSMPEVLPTVAQRQMERLHTHLHVLDRLTAAAQLLSGNPLCVLDPRINLDEQFGAPRYSLKDRPLDFDLQAARSIAEQLQQNGLATARVTVPPLDHTGRKNVARSFFGVDCLYPWQHECLDAILSPDPQSEPIAITASTGGGKSLVYQLPALYAALFTGRLTLVVAPLRALMQEQCQKLWQAGFVLMVDRLSGDMSEAENQDVYRRIADGQVTVLYIAPERFRSRRFQDVLYARLQRDRRLEYWVFDEAHCISLWGHSFRPEYLHAAELAARLRQDYCEDGVAPVLLLTATLPPQVQTDLEYMFTPHDQTIATTNR